MDRLKTLHDEGYFKTEEEYQKAVVWIQRGIIPEWFKQDLDTRTEDRRKNE